VHGHEPLPAQLRGTPTIAPRHAGPGETTTTTGPALAKPPVRKLARDLGVDLHTIIGSGTGGLVTRADVERARVGRLLPQEPVAPERRDQRTPIRGIRRATAEAMQRSAAVPTASVRLAVDVTETLRARARLAELPETQGVPVTILAFVARALLVALRRRPILHARWDEQASEIVTPHQVDLGIAVASSRGLLVPKIRAADRLPLVELAAAVARVAVTARNGQSSPEDLRNGTITITNVGVFDVDGGTPLLTPGETAILCLGAVRERPWVADGALAVRQVVELTLTFDHRVLDGEEAGRFLADVGALLRDPVLLLVRS
jgi:pyruvate dehydrogenase E2 component (dihydrolipoamide acetyltransferase)